MPSEVWVRINSDQLAYFSLLQLAELLADGRLSPQQLAGVFTARLMRFDSLLHPVVTLTTELANQQAAAAQAALQAANTSAAATTRSSSTSPKSNMLHNVSLLTGVPYGLKDLMAVPGYPTSWGLSQLRNRTINEPSAAYSVLSAAGGVLLAKTATGELAWGDVWFNGITTRNPWNINTGSCGSSAGSAVAVAAGLLPFAVGTETWGSIVCPASTVGVTAYRPTGGSISGQGTMQAEVAVSLEGLWLEGYIDQDSHWYPLIQLGQVAPASAYLKAQRLRSVLAAQTRHYFAANGIDVLLKPTKSKAVTDFHEVHPILV
ncbi:hypothetical protein OEZ86_002693 [Tetradesmus obliquus]|nr:hypothetical protein OEZ86_002693 [Tetradesmus obliquus]